MFMAAGFPGNDADGREKSAADRLLAGFYRRRGAELL